MNIESFVSAYGLLSGTYLLCLVSGFLPIVNAEILILFLSTFSTKSSLFMILMAATIGQMTAKVLLYFAGRGAVRLPTKRVNTRILAAMKGMPHRKLKIDAFILFSAFRGFPPFYLVTLASGFLKHDFFRFFICGFAGRAVRFGALVLFPRFFKKII